MSALSDATDNALAAERADEAQQLAAAQASLSSVQGQLATVLADDAAQKALVAQLQAELLDEHDLTAWTKQGPALSVAGDLIGEGSTRTIYSMPADTSTVAAKVAALASGVANPYWLLWLGGTSQSNVVESPTYRDFWLRGTDQGHFYEGVQVRYTKSATLDHIKLTGANPGQGTTPPGEAKGLYFYYCDDARTIDCVLDGRIDSAGPTVSSTLAGHWQSDSIQHDGLTAIYSNGFGVAHSGGTHGDIVYNAPEIGWCDGAFNFEKMDANAQGTHVTITDPNIHDIARAWWGQFSTGNLKASMVVDFVFTKQVPASVPVKLYGTSANSGTNGQKSTDIHVTDATGASPKDVTSTVLHVV